MIPEEDLFDKLQPDGTSREQADNGALTFHLLSWDRDRLISHLEKFSQNKNEAIIAWLNAGELE